LLTPSQVEDYAQRAAAAFDDLELDILTDIARRIAKADYMTEGAQWQAERAQALGASRKHLAERMERLMAAAAPHVAVIFAQAMLDAEEQDNRFYRAAGQPEPEGIGTSAVAQQIVQSGYRRTMNTLYNLTQTRALLNNHNLPVAVQEQLGRMLDKGHMDVTTGAFSYDQIVRRGIKDLAAEGIDAITYPSGHTDKLETVVLRAMRTGINQTATDISQHNANTMNVDIMELSAHGGARTGDGGQDFTNHSWWQGKLVSLSGQPGYLTLEDIGYGDVRGFAGANCRHNWHPFWPGISKPAYTQAMLDDYNAPKFPYNGQMLTEEQADRRQRALERQIRRWKLTSPTYEATQRAAWPLPEAGWTIFCNRQAGTSSSCARLSPVSGTARPAARCGHPDNKHGTKARSHESSGPFRYRGQLSSRARSRNCGSKPKSA